MRPHDQELFSNLEARLLRYNQVEKCLPGIAAESRRSSFVGQLIESIRRIKYVQVMLTRDIGEFRRDPSDPRFDPLMAAALEIRCKNFEEAFWLVFLFTHFGKHRKAGWRYAREVYGRCSEGGKWDWVSTKENLVEFRRWLDDHQDYLKRSGEPKGFGNHRKYQSLDAYSETGTGAAVETYVNWISPRTHVEMFEEACENANDNPRLAFDILYESMSCVASFGRTARFDYLTMVGKIGLAEVEPGSTYMQSATGPVRGARLLFGGKPEAALSPRQLDASLVDLESHLKVGMQVLEDALCNWQKSPAMFKGFRG